MLNVIFCIYVIMSFYYMFYKCVSVKAANIYGIIVFASHLLEVILTTDWIIYPSTGLLFLSVGLFNRYNKTGFFGLLTMCSCPIVVKCFLL